MLAMKDDPSALRAAVIVDVLQGIRNGRLLIGALPEFPEHILARPEEVLGVEEDLDADAGAPFGIVGAVVDGRKAAGGEVGG